MFSGRMLVKPIKGSVMSLVLRRPLHCKTYPEKLFYWYSMKAESNEKPAPANVVTFKPKWIPAIFFRGYIPFLLHKKLMADKAKEHKELTAKKEEKIESLSRKLGAKHDQLDTIRQELFELKFLIRVQRAMDRIKRGTPETCAKVLCMKSNRNT